MIYETNTSIQFTNWLLILWNSFGSITFFFLSFLKQWRKKMSSDTCVWYIEVWLLDSLGFYIFCIYINK